MMVLGAVVISSGAESFLLALPRALVELLLVFAAILVHELGHSLVARRLGVRIQEIELHFFGGAAKMLDMPKTPRDEVLIAAAGPATSFALAVSFGALFFALPWPVRTLGLLFGANLLLGAFNLAPALPMDGGRILRAALTPRLGLLSATRISVKVARVIAASMAAYGLIGYSSLVPWQGNIFLVLLAAFLWMLGSRELELAEMMTAAGPRVEVVDEQGRAVPGATVGAPASSFGPSRAGTGHVAGAAAEHVVVIHGPDGRLWVIRQRS